jgi:hypothetical protein
MALWCRQPRVIAATTAWMRWARRTRLSCLGISRFTILRLPCWPPCVPLRNVLYVDEGQLLTSAGLSAGIDLCLYMVRLDYGAGPATIQAPGPGPGARPGKR